MLTSRNREKQLLDQEIEDLRLAARRDGNRSIAGDSVVDRSIPRFHGRPTSRASNTTKVTQLSDAERESYENKNAELRDINAGLKLEIQDVTRELEACVEELENVDAAKFDYQSLQQKYDRDMAIATQDLQNLQAERDEALRLQEDLEIQFQELDRNAQDKVTSLIQEIEEKDQDWNELDLELKNRDDALNELSNEVRHTRDNFAHLEEVMKEKEREIDELAEENQTAHDNYQKLQNEHRELVSKSDRCHVQNQGYQKETKFLREEQESDKIKIGNLQAELTSFKGRIKELDNRLAQEKHQREVIDSKEKRELQTIMDDLNREVSDGKAESTDLKQNLQSREVELTSFKERLLELENNLREVLGEPNGTRSSLLAVRIPRVLQLPFTNFISRLLNCRKNLRPQPRNWILRGILYRRRKISCVTVMLSLKAMVLSRRSSRNFLTASVKLAVPTKPNMNNGRRPTSTQHGLLHRRTSVLLSSSRTGRQSGRNCPLWKPTTKINCKNVINCY